MMGERDELWVHVLEADAPAKWYTLTAFAAALRPLLAQPAPADVLSLDAKLQRAEMRAADMADTVAAQEATIAKLTAERDEARRRCDLNYLTATREVAVKREECDELRRQLAAAEQKFIAAIAGAVEAYGNHKRDDTLQAQLRQAEQERDELAAKWASVPWDTLSYIVECLKFLGGDTASARLWIDVNRPRPTD